MNVQDIRVAIHEDIIQQLVELPRPIAKKVNEWIQKFRQNPKATGLNFERIQKARDSKLRSVRVDQAYRGIVAAPEQGNIYLLLRVAKHDEAYRWAENVRVEIHPETGGLQVFHEVAPETVPAPLAPAPAETPALFDAFRDRELVRLGVPEALLPDVRSLKEDDDLLDRVEHYPKLAWDALVGLAEGKSLEEVHAEQGRESAGAVDTADFAAALESAETQSSFFVADDEEELQRVLNQPLERWRIFLHPSQRRLVERSWNGPVRVLGSAGTGKTVVVMHRARWLAEHIATKPGERVLVTTFTRNLAADIRASLEKLCNSEQLARIHVTNLDGWAQDYLKRTGVDFETVYNEARLRDAWNSAMTVADPALDLELPFYRAEWSEVVVANGIHDEATYLRVPRTGRGVRLNRLQRKQVWLVLDNYRAEIERRRWKDGDEAILHAAEMLERETDAPTRFRSVVVDETQDLSGPALRLIRALASPRDNDLFLVGDGHQRIYRRRTSLGAYGINIRGRGRKLRINYRTTEEIRRFAIAVLEGVPIDDLDGEIEARSADTSLMHGAAPTIRACPDEKAELDAAAEHIRDLLKNGSPDSGICVAVRSNRDADHLEEALGRQGLYVHKLSRRSADDRRRPGVRVATMHRIKGLEFDHVLIVGAGANRIPDQQALVADDELSKREADWRERALLYVAATRARRSLWVSAAGPLTSYLKNT